MFYPGTQIASEAQQSLCRYPRAQHVTTKASTAGIHVANVLRQLGIADDVAARLRIFPNGATAMRELAGVRGAAPDRLHAIDRDHQHEGCNPSGSLPPGCELATMYTAGITAAAAHPQQAQNLIDLLTGAGQHEQRKRAGFISGRSQVPT